MFAWLTTAFIAMRTLWQLTLSHVAAPFAFTAMLIILFPRQVAVFRALTHFCQASGSFDGMCSGGEGSSQTLAIPTPESASDSCR